MDSIETNTCKLCQLSLPDEIAFHKHLKSHEITQIAYYQKFYPRYDKLDGSLIRFKNRDFYFTSDFNSRDNLATWLNKAGPDEAKEYVKSYLLRRKERKNLVFAPCQVELRSLPIPGLAYLNKLFGSYYQACEEIGFKLRHKDFVTWDAPLYLTKHHKIFIDSREKDILDFRNVSTEVRKLDYGDYCFSDNDWTGKTYVERKSLNDFIGTFSFKLRSFRNELDRAREEYAYVIIIIEETLHNCLRFKDLPYLPKQIKVSPEFIFFNVREIIQDYDNVQFLFVESHAACGKMVEKLFSFGKAVQHYDLQLLKDINKI